MKSLKSLLFHAVIVVGLVNTAMTPFYFVAKPGIDVERSVLMQIIYDYVIYLQGNFVAAAIFGATGIFTAAWSIGYLYKECTKPSAAK